MGFVVSFFDDLSNIIFTVVVLVVLFGLTERWRIERQAQRKRERQNRQSPGSA